MLLVVTYSRRARASLRNVRHSHEEQVVRSFGRAALLAATELGAFLGLRLREKHPETVQLLWTEPFNEFRSVPERVREAATAYEAREATATPYDKFAAGTEHPSPAAMADRPLEAGGTGRGDGHRTDAGGGRKRGRDRDREQDRNRSQNQNRSRNRDRDRDRDRDGDR